MSGGMEKLKKILEKNKSDLFPVDIFSILKENKISLEYFSFKKLNWLAIDNKIVINSKLSEKEKRFYIGHELCHILLKENRPSISLLSSSDFRETRANDFSTDLFVPKDDLKQAYIEYENIPTLSDMFSIPEEIIEKQLKKIFIGFQRVPDNA